MTNKTAGRIVVLALFATTVLHARAQETSSAFPRGEFYVGFSYTNENLGSLKPVFVPASRNYYGIEFEGNWNLRRNLGIVFDFAGQFGRSLALSPSVNGNTPDLVSMQVLIGPQFTLRRRSTDVFARTLVGLNYTALGVDTGVSCGFADCALTLASRTGLALGVGGGLELKMGPYMAFRPFQADYLPSRLAGSWQRDFRVSAGLTLKFDYHPNL